MIVIDASTLVKYVLHEENWDSVGRYLREMKPLYSIDHVLKEVGNAVWKHYYLSKKIGLDDALELYQAFLKLIETEVIIVEPEIEYIQKALEIALRYGITLYDSLYLAQAEKHGELLTSDRKQAKIAGELGIKVHIIP